MVPARHLFSRGRPPTRGLQQNGARIFGPGIAGLLTPGSSPFHVSCLTRRASARTDLVVAPMPKLVSSAHTRGGPSMVHSERPASNVAARPQIRPYPGDRLLRSARSGMNFLQMTTAFVGYQRLPRGRGLCWPSSARSWLSASLPVPCCGRPRESAAACVVGIGPRLLVSPLSPARMPQHPLFRAIR